ncbi:MAG: hypothetical protein HQK78_13975 [Desulfobacterales bacterium]|nr:hypothetical protein [Desulfobacterales bacterium]
MFKFFYSKETDEWLDIIIPVSLDKYVYNDYASRLIPLSMSYAAGLLEYFFRGKLELTYDSANSKYEITNNSEEDMNGTFEIYYDNNKGERVKYWDNNFEIKAKTSGNNKFDISNSFTEAKDIKETGRYILIFRGKLGNENNAIVGKVVDLYVSFKIKLIRDIDNNVMTPKGYGEGEDQTRITIYNSNKNWCGYAIPYDSDDKYL